MQYLNLSGGTDFILEPSLDCEVIHFPSGFESTLRLKEAPPEEVTIVARIETAREKRLIQLEKDKKTLEKKRKQLENKKKEIEKELSTIAYTKHG